VTRRVLVTGASGFVGRPAVAALAERGVDVHAVTLSQPATGPDGVEWHRCNLLEAGAARALVERVRPDELLHLAWKTGRRTLWESLENDRWQASGVELVESFAAGGGRRAVVAGTCAEYRWGGAERLREDSPLSPQSRYSAAKDGMRRQLERIPGVSLAWARLFFLYGPGQDAQRLVPSVIDAIQRGERPKLSEGSQRRDYLYVDDAASALVELLGAELTGPVNVASGRALSVRELVLAVADALGGRELIEFGALSAPDDAELVEADIERLRAAIRFAPRDLEAGVAETVSRRSEGRWC
jgi:nucleoside-diphosphate-sugar epimerase